MANSADPDQLASSLIWIYNVCKCRVYPGSAGPGLKYDQVDKVFFCFVFSSIKKQSLEGPHQGTCNEYLQHVFIKK